MRAILDAVDGGVAQVDVRGRHVNLRAQDTGTLGKLAVLHAQEEIHVLLGRAVTVRGVFARLGQRAAVFANLLLGEVIDVRQPAADEVERKLVNLIVLLGRIIHIGVVETEPVDIVLNRLDEFFLFLGGVCIVKAEIANAAKAFSGQKIDGKRLYVTDMQIAVRFRREARLHPSAVFALGKIGFDCLPNKVGLFPDFFCHGNPSYRILQVPIIRQYTIPAGQKQDPWKNIDASDKKQTF